MMVFCMLDNISTEKRNVNSILLDTMSIDDAVELMIDEENNVIKALHCQKSKIVSVINETSRVLVNGGRIIYIGAGTSGRIGILDAVECPPTFGVDYNTVVGIIAGGENAFIKAQEGAEDSFELAEVDLQNISLTSKDIVVGLAASGRTPYVIGGLRYAKSIGSKTVAISCCNNAKISSEAEIFVEAVAGAEVLTGSTRLKAGTTQKLILNMISTLSMRSLGKIYQNLMVDVKSSNEKLIERAKQIIIDATGVEYAVAEKFYIKANQSVKVAIVMILNDCSYDNALLILTKNNSFIKKES
jgi:N-acetylmuramic acid 6-phosphate etherase